MAFEFCYIAFETYEKKFIILKNVVKYRTISGFMINTKKKFQNCFKILGTQIVSINIMETSRRKGHKE